LWQYGSRDHFPVREPQTEATRHTAKYHRRMRRRPATRYVASSLGRS
jgi:hypothetical protein